MYGTMARMIVQPGKEAAIEELHERWNQERKPEAKGLMADYILKSDRVPGEVFMLAVFDTEENYRRNAEDPDQHRQYLELRSLLEADPEWNDGVVRVVEPAVVPL
jgi:heme-degrading monooxygenase HmoA